jgi:hypothetical protein
MTWLHMLFGLFLGCVYNAEPHRPMSFRRRCCLVVLFVSADG